MIAAFLASRIRAHAVDTAAATSQARGACRPDKLNGLVAAHNGDLMGARAAGLRTACVPRPREYGPQQTSDLSPDAAVDLVAQDFLDLAEQLT